MLQEKPSALKREHPARQNMKILFFFLYLRVIFALLDPDPATKNNADPVPDPQPCSQHHLGPREPPRPPYLKITSQV
jgi:hypothetical protein